jgi:hypothetical protein
MEFPRRQSLHIAAALPQPAELASVFGVWERGAP